MAVQPIELLEQRKLHGRLIEAAQCCLVAHVA